MDYRNNAAGRLRGLLQRARSAPGNKATADVWAEIFHIETGPGYVRDREVARQLGIAGEQLARVREDARSAGRDLTVTRLDHAETFLDVRVLAANWDQAVKPRLTEEAATVLETCAEHAPADEEPLTSDVLVEYAKTVDALREAVEAAEVPAIVKDFLQRQIALMQRAQRDYPLRGVAAFREASDISAAEWLNADPAVHRAEGPAVRQTRDFWPSFDKIAPRVIVLGNIAKFVWHAGSPLLALVSGHHPGMTAGLPELAQFLLGPGAPNGK